MASKDDTLKESGCFNGNHENVKADIFGTGPFFDKKDIVQVKYEMIRAASNGEDSVAGIAEAYGFSRKSYYKIGEAFKTGGLPALIPKKTGPKGAHKLTADVLRFIDLYLADNRSAKAQEVSDAVESEKGVRIHPRTIYRLLKKNGF